MADLKKLIAGIIMVGIGLALILSAGQTMAAIGAIIGVVGAGIVVFVLSRGYF